MNKPLITLSLIVIAVLSLGGVYSYANENENISELKLNKVIDIDDDSEVFEISGEGKNKTQFRIKDNHNDEDSEFMIKGVISASSSSSITVDGKVINIDSSVTEEIKIVGKIEIGAYVMAKGVVKDSNFYAEKVVVDQRNKKDMEDEDEEDEEVNPSISPSPSATPTATSSSAVQAEENNEQEEGFALNRLILSLEDILASLRKFVLGI